MKMYWFQSHFILLVWFQADYGNCYLSFSDNFFLITNFFSKFLELKDPLRMTRKESTKYRVLGYVTERAVNKK